MTRLKSLSKFLGKLYKRKEPTEPSWLKRIPDGYIHCYVCNQLVKYGQSHCGVITGYSSHPLRVNFPAKSVDIPSTSET